MKQLIMDVLEDMSGGQINLASEAARKTVANTIVAAIKTNKKGWFLDIGAIDGKPKLTKEELETQRAKETWVCSICGESTYYVDYDYIGSGTNHLGCEMKSWDEIKDHVNKKDDSDYYTGPDREKNWLQKKHENKVFGGDTGIDADFGHDLGGSYESTDTMTGHDHGKVWTESDAIQKQAYLEMTSDGLPEGGDVQAVLESHKLADEIVDNKGKWIYESPDGGETVFRRPFSDYDPKNKEEIDWKTKKPTGRKFTEYNNGNWRSKKGE